MRRGAIAVDSRSNRVYFDGRAIKLACEEFDLFFILWRARTGLVSAKLQSKLWGALKPRNPSEAMRQRIYHLRFKIARLGLKIECRRASAYHDPVYHLNFEREPTHENDHRVDRQGRHPDN